MSKLLSFGTAVGIAITMVIIAFINGQYHENGVLIEPRLNPPFVATLLIYLVLASLIPMVMVPIGLVVILIEVLNTRGDFVNWISEVTRGPAKNA